MNPKNSGAFRKNSYPGVGGWTTTVVAFLFMFDFSTFPGGLGKSSKKSESRKIAAGNKQLADTGNYPGEDEITQGLTLINPLIADKNSEKFIERFNTLKKDLLDLADHFHDLEHFFDYQRPTWEKLRKAHVAFQLNRLELEKDAQAGSALKRMQEILSARSPYGLIASPGTPTLIFRS